MPIELRTDRRLLIGPLLATIIILAFGIFAATKISAEELAISLAVTSALLSIGVLGLWIFAFPLFKPHSLKISKEGVTYIRWLRESHWDWAEVDEIKTFTPFALHARTATPGLQLHLKGRRRPAALGSMWQSPFGVNSAGYVLQLLREAKAEFCDGQSC